MLTGGRSDGTEEVALGFKLVRTRSWHHSAFSAAPCYQRLLGRFTLFGVNVLLIVCGI